MHNPFIAGNPVTGSLFVGREAIFRELEELWGSDPRPGVPSVVLYGHRRMGKSSILQNLGTRFGRDTIVAQFTMQRLGRVRQTGELLYALALSIFDALRDHDRHFPITEPVAEHYANNGYVAFDQFLREVKKEIGTRRIIQTIDEFELIEKAIAEGQIDAELLDYIRGVIHSEPWFILALAGLHTLQEMTADYWHPLFASVHPIRVSFLDRPATIDLLANPTGDFPLDFTGQTIDRVFHWVQGQPYLTQLVGHLLVRHYNQEVFEQGRQREARITPADIDQVVHSAEFYEMGSYYFTGVWGQAEQGDMPGQTAILHHLAQQAGPVEREILWAATGLEAETGREALHILKQHDVIRENDAGQISFTVPLMRHWLRHFQS